jgi:3-hydroxy-9,10-secoandrosta-1,3,5(10)-triene-9,17-dione monooxygenase reductase component
MGNLPAFDVRELRNAFGTFATGVTVVTMCGQEGRDIGLTANSFSSVSLSPAMILWSLAKTSSNIEPFRQTTHFAVHVLAADQEDLSARFSRKDVDRFQGLDVGRGPGGVPLLRNCTARFACRTAFQYEGGDHVIFVGEVMDFTHSERPPLVFHRGRYGMLLRKEAALPAVAGEPKIAPSPDDLIYHVARVYYGIRRNATRDRQRRGWSEREYVAMSVLGWKDDCCLGDIDEFAQTRGLRATPEVIAGLAARGLVEAVAPIATDSKVKLTSAGRQSVIELMAILKADEAQAAEDLDPSEMQLLNQLLRKIGSAPAP